MSISTLSCVCCGSDVTAPQFHKGQVYGWSCIKKVAPSQKRKRDNGLWIQAETSIEALEGYNAVKLVAVVGGLKFSVTSYKNSSDWAEHNGQPIVDGAMMISRSKRVPQSIWPTLQVFDGVVYNKRTGKPLA